MSDRETSPPFAEMQCFLGKHTADFPGREDRDAPDEQPVSIRTKKGWKRTTSPDGSEAEERPIRSSPNNPMGVFPRKARPLRRHKNTSRADRNLTLLKKVRTAPGARMGPMRSGTRRKWKSYPTTIIHRTTSTVHLDGRARSKRIHGGVARNGAFLNGARPIFLGRWGEAGRCLFSFVSTSGDRKWSFQRHKMADDVAESTGGANKKEDGVSPSLK